MIGIDDVVDQETERRVRRGLDRSYALAVERKYELRTGIDQARIIIFSDLHRGVRDSADDFLRCEKAYSAALGYYLEAGYTLIVLGDSLHNFVDGVLIAAAFLTDSALGWTTAVAVIAHEVPQEVGDFMVLLDAGYTRRRALILNALSSLASVAGGVLGYFALHRTEDALPYILALAAAGFIYIAVADLIPNLHRRFAVKDALSQVALIVLGVAVVVLAGQGHGH